MTYDLTPQVMRLTPFKNEGKGPGVAAVQLVFGPIAVAAILCKTATGYFISLPSRHSEARDKWYEQVAIGDLGLMKRAQEMAIEAYEKVSMGELVSV